MKKRLLIYILPALLWGCQLHEEPELTADGEMGVDPTAVTLTANLTLNINLSEKAGTSRTMTDNSGHLHRFTVEAYLNRQPIKRQVIVEEITDRTHLTLPVSMQLHARNYQLVVWSDYVKADTQNEDLYYDTEDLVPLIPVNASHTGNTEYKDAFAASVPVDLGNYREQWEAEVPIDIELARPVARYELVTNDVASFLRKVASGDIEGKKFTARIKYSSYLSVGYNILDDVPKHSLMYMQYSKTFDLPAEGSTELNLGFDYVFVAAGEGATYIPVEIEVVNEEGVTVASNALRIPCIRGKNSIVKGAFLTETSDEGIDFDPGYDGEIDLEVDVRPL